MKRVLLLLWSCYNTRGNLYSLHAAGLDILITYYVGAQWYQLRLDPEAKDVKMWKL